MLQAKQKALQEQVSQLKRDLQQLPETSQSSNNEGRAQAQEHLDEALEQMDDFQARLTESRYQAQMDSRQSSETLKTMEAAKDQMDLAQKAIESELTWTDDQRMANEAQEMAEQLAADADAFDESVTEAEREDMLARLEAAKRLLETMPEPQWAQVGKGRRNPSSPTAVLTKNPNIAPAEAARQMARQFWSIALNAKKRQHQLLDDESSDLTFYGQENEFFENAAKFDSKPVQK
jgi:cell division septum initiation protein DivIVA